MVCGKFLKSRKNGGFRRECCSDLCRAKNAKQYFAARYRENHVPARGYTCKCGWCEKEFTRNPLARGQEKFCSIECRSNYQNLTPGSARQRGNARQTAKNSFVRLSKRFADQKVCRFCNHQFVPRTHKSTVCYDRECVLAYNREKTAKYLSTHRNEVNKRNREATKERRQSDTNWANKERELRRRSYAKHREKIRQRHAARMLNDVTYRNRVRATNRKTHLRRKARNQ